MPLDQALAYMQVAHLPLHYDEEREVDIFTSARKVPISLRRSVVKHRRQLLQLVQEADHRTCVNPGLHRQSWYYRGQAKYICGLCEKLEPYMRSA